jgi:RNA-directed DNA polymerase
LGNLSTPISVQKLQMALHAKAKSEAGYRFYALYDKIYREDILAHAYAQCRSNKGAPGVDRQDFADIEAYGVQRGWRTGACAQRGDVPTGSDPESVHPESQWQTSAAGYLDPARSGVHDSSDAGARTDLRSRPSLRAVRLPAGPQCPAGGDRGGGTLHRGQTDVVDADLADYFGSIPHAELMLSLARRIVDRRVLHLIKMWLECAVEETDDEGGRHARPRPRISGAAFRRAHPSHHCCRICTCGGLCWGGRSSGWSKALGSRIVTYADDLVILCKRGKAKTPCLGCARSWVS